MRAQRFWIEIVLVATAIACALAILIATFGIAASAVDGRNSSSPTNPKGQQEQEVGRQKQAYEGMVTCSRCGAQHPASLNSSATTCVRTCVHGGERFVLVNSESTYLLEGDLGDLKKFAGQRARLVGTLHGKTIRVSSAQAGT